MEHADGDELIPQNKAGVKQRGDVNRGDGNKHKRRQYDKKGKSRQYLATFLGKPTTKPRKTAAQNDGEKRDGDRKDVEHYKSTLAELCCLYRDRPEKHSRNYCGFYPVSGVADVCSD